MRVMVPATVAWIEGEGGVWVVPWPLEGRGGQLGVDQGDPGKEGRLRRWFLRILPHPLRVVCYTLARGYDVFDASTSALGRARRIRVHHVGVAV